MKTIELKSTKGGKFTIELPQSYKKIKLPFFKKWVSALESGKYRQCTNTLCEPRNNKLSYCCLGVLSKVQNRLTKDKKWGNDYYDNADKYSILSQDNPCYEVFSSSGNFPKNVVVSRVNNQSLVTCLTECNDNLNLSFKDIAKIIKILYKA